MSLIFSSQVIICSGSAIGQEFQHLFSDKCSTFKQLNEIENWGDYQYSSRFFFKMLLSLEFYSSTKGFSTLYYSDIFHLFIILSRMCVWPGQLIHRYFKKLVFMKLCFNNWWSVTSAWFEEISKHNYEYVIYNQKKNSSNYLDCVQRKKILFLNWVFKAKLHYLGYFIFKIVLILQIPFSVQKIEMKYIRISKSI